MILQSPKITSRFGKYYVESLVPLLSIFKTHQINMVHWDFPVTTFYVLQGRTQQSSPEASIKSEKCLWNILKHNTCTHATAFQEICAHGWVSAVIRSLKRVYGVPPKEQTVRETTGPRRWAVDSSCPRGVSCLGEGELSRQLQSYRDKLYPAVSTGCWDPVEGGQAISKLWVSENSPEGVSPREPGSSLCSLACRRRSFRGPAGRSRLGEEQGWLQRIWLATESMWERNSGSEVKRAHSCLPPWAICCCPFSPRRDQEGGTSAGKWDESTRKWPAHSECSVCVTLHPSSKLCKAKLFLIPGVTWKK